MTALRPRRRRGLDASSLPIGHAVIRFACHPCGLSWRVSLEVHAPRDLGRPRRARCRGCRGLVAGRLTLFVGSET
jgi:hypothetical protein